MSLCFLPYREHRLEFREEKNGEASYVCAYCNETIIFYVDTQGA